MGTLHVFLERLIRNILFVAARTGVKKHRFMGSDMVTPARLGRPTITGAPPPASCSPVLYFLGGQSQVEMNVEMFLP